MSGVVSVLSITAAVLAALAIIRALTYSGSRHCVGVEIEAPASEVFEWATEPSKVAQWMEGLVEMTPLGDGVLKVGAKARNVVQGGNRQMTMVSEVIGLEMDRKLVVAIQMDDSTLSCVSEYSFEEANGCTHVELIYKSQFEQFLAKAFSPIINVQIRRLLESNFRRLKSRVEGGTLVT